MSIADRPSHVTATAPATSYDEALQRFARLRALDTAEIRPGAESQLRTHGERTAKSVVLLHGFTNCPIQYERLGEELFARGWNVVVPRFPGHGRADRDPAPLGRVEAGAFLATAFDAFDLACGLGERTSVLGISSGGAIAARLAFERAELARAVCIAPLFGLLALPHVVDVLLALVMPGFPNVDVPWDPSGKNDEIPSYSYLKFPTRALGRLLGIGLDVAGTLGVPLGGEAVVVTNDRDPAVSNALAEAAGLRWNRRRPGFSTFYRFTDLPENHDIIDPNDARQRTELVYPVLLDLLERP